MSLSTALSLETMTPDALFAASERDLCELWQYYDSNGDGLIQFDEFAELVGEVVNRMAAQLPSQIPQRYCLEFGLSPSVLAGIDVRIAAKFASVNRSNLAKAIFLELDTEENLPPKPLQDSTVKEETTAEQDAPSDPAPASTPRAQQPELERKPSPAPGDAAATSPGAAAAATTAGADSDPNPAVKGVRGFLEPSQLRPLHTLMEKHLLKDLYESIGLMMVQKQMSAMA